MAKAALPTNRVYLFRLITLTVDCGTTVVRKVFDHRCQNTSLTVLLAHEKTTITRLRTQKAITSVQFDLLYPSSGPAPTSADFDLTLAICLLRNLRPCGLNRKFDWSSPPPPGDTSLEADLCRLRRFRNELAHISTTTGIDETNFLTKWADIEQILNRLNASVLIPVQNLKQTILDHKNNPLDPETEERVEKEIKKWEEFEKELETKVENVQKDVIDLKDDMGDMKNDVEVVKDDFMRVKNELKQFKKTKGELESEAKKTPSIFRRLQEKINMPKLKKETWTIVLDNSNERVARHLLKLGVLPQPDEFERAYKTFRKTEIFLDICQSICSHLKEKSKDIVNVWAAYKTKGDEETDVVFVVCSRNKSIDVDFGGFPVYQRLISEYSTESSKVLAEESNKKFDKTLLNEMRRSIQARSKKLTENHSNITMISPSIFKSKRFGQVSHELIVTKRPCIALYVHIKGLIPIIEEPFPAEIDGFPTDVREAGFIPFNGGPNEFHEHLKMGCAVHANVMNKDGNVMGGTLGGFVHHPDYGKCCFTCAHVVSNPDDMKNVRDTSGGRFVLGADNNHFVYQPACSDSRQFGRLVCVVFKEGGEVNSGIDAALIQITDRFPRYGDFPDASNYMEAGFDINRPMILNSGITRNLSDDDLSTEVVKFGAVTGASRGVVRMNGSMIRLSNMPVSDLGYLLNNQVEILSVGSEPFALNGDSGALVFAKDRSKELVAVGMVEGGMSDGRIMITPVCEILSELAIPLSESSSTDEHLPFYLKLQQSTDSSVDSGVDMAVDV